MTRKDLVAILDDEEAFLTQTRFLLRDHFEVQTHQNVESLLTAIGTLEPDALLLDVDLGPDSIDGFEVFERLMRSAHAVPTIILTQKVGLEVTARAIELGVPFLQKDISLDTRNFARRIKQAIRKSQLEAEAEYLRFFHEGAPELTETPWTDSRMGKRVLGQLEKFAGTDMPLVLEGEVGTGKLTSAKWAAERSSTDSQVFRIVTTIGRSEEDVRLELFGGETASGRLTRGALAAAVGGVVFIKDMNSLPIALLDQLRLCVETGVFSPTGSGRRQRLHCRIMGSRRGPFGALDSGLESFWGAYLVKLPALREHLEDFEFHLAYAGRTLAWTRTLDSHEMDVLKRTGLPGNFHDLRSALVRGVAPQGQSQEERFQDAVRSVSAWPWDRIATLSLQTYVAELERLYSNDIGKWVKHAGRVKSTIHRWRRQFPG